MAAITIGAAGSALIASIGWVSSLPAQFKYIIFLGGLAGDAGISTIFGFDSGVVGGSISFIISTAFGMPSFIVTSFQLLVIFTAMPIILFLLKSGKVPS